MNYDQEIIKIFLDFYFLIHHSTFSDGNNVEKYYDDMSNDYENVVRSWGYNMSEAVVEALEIHGNLNKQNVSSMLDIGCGDGLCGHILKVIRFIDICKMAFLSET